MTGPLKRTMIAAFDVVDGQLAVGGVPLERLAARAGTTPFFAYDRRLLTERVDYIRATLPPRIELAYAMKANPMPAVVQHLARLEQRLRAVGKHFPIREARVNGSRCAGPPIPHCRSRLLVGPPAGEPEARDRCCSRVGHGPTRRESRVR